MFLVLFGSAILLSGCGSSATPVPATQAPAAATPTAAPTIAATPVTAPTPTAAAVVATPSGNQVPSLGPGETMMDADWTVFAPAGAGFTSKFASTPTLTTQTAATAVGDAKISLWTDEEGGNLSYYVQVTSYPTGSMATADLSKAYDAAVNSMAGGSSDLTVAGQQAMTLDGHAGRAFLLTSALGSVKGGVWIVGDTMYMAYVAYTSSVDPNLIDTFLYDFHITA